MPSRRSVAFIVLFWLVTTGYVVYRDMWPVLFSSGPPPVAIDLADEAAQRIPTRWKVLWNGKNVGQLDTQMTYDEHDDSFWFSHKYKNLRVEIAGVNLFIPGFTTSVRMTRDGNLKDQFAGGKLNVEVNGVTRATVDAKVSGRVVDGQLFAEFSGFYQIADRKEQYVSRKFDPVPVPKGQPLNPLQPVNRIAGVRPGRRWVVHESNPLNDAVLAVAGEFGVKPPEETKRPLIGEVLSEPQDLDWRGKTISCWVIEYRRDELEVRTWVRVTDGKVFKQEAFKKGDNLSIEREE